MAGQGENQPTEGVNTLDGIAGLMDGVEVPEELAETEEAEAEEAGDESESEEEGEGAEEAEQDDEAEVDSESFTITHDGKDIQVNKAEAIELAQKGLDYTKKTMALAEERKALEPIKAQVQEKLTQHEQALNETLHRLQAAADFLESELGQPPEQALLHYDASAYLVQKEAYQARVDKLKNTYGQIQYLSQEQNQLRQSQLLEQANETEKYLVEHLPGWKDAPEKALAELNSYIKEYGLSPETTKEAYVQKGLWEIAHKAREYDKLIAEKAKLTPKANLPKVNKPSANTQPANVRQQEAFKRFNKKPSLETLADLL